MKCKLAENLPPRRPAASTVTKAIGDLASLASRRAWPEPSRSCNAACWASAILDGCADRLAQTGDRAELGDLGMSFAVGEPTIEEGLDKALTKAARVVQRIVEATTDEITSELQEALKI